MIISATFSKPTAAVETALGAKYLRVKIKLITASAASAWETWYALELYTDKQAFHKKLSAAECDAFLEAHAGKTFRSCVERTESEEITILSNKHGKITRLSKPLAKSGPRPTPAGSSSGEGLQLSARPAPGAVLEPFAGQGLATGLNRKKKYLLPEGAPVPFLVHLGVMTAEGRVLAAKYDKFRQINRFLEYIDDLLPAVLRQRKPTEEAPLRVVDFGCGKSYLTFAVHYFLTAVRGIPCDVTGLDLKEDVIAYCKKLAARLTGAGSAPAAPGTEPASGAPVAGGGESRQSLHFSVGDIAHYGADGAPDIVITLHACDTATDYALDYAVRQGAKAILSVPCCQHELNAQLDSSRKTADPAFAPLLKYGLLKERFAALATDALRAEYLEGAGYKVQLLEFIDMSHTPKNLLIRALRREGPVPGPAGQTAGNGQAGQGLPLEQALGISPLIRSLLAHR